MPKQALDKIPLGFGIVVEDEPSELSCKDGAYLYYVNLLFSSVPDLHIEGTLEAIHAMLDKPQLEIVKGLIDLNLGEPIEDFEKPSTVIRDPVAQVHLYV